MSDKTNLTPREALADRLRAILAENRPVRLLFVCRRNNLHFWTRKASPLCLPPL